MDKKHIESGLSQEQLDAVADLARTNVYAKQSKWKTFRELPKEEKFPFFVQHFLLATVAIVAAVAIVIGLGVFYATRPPSTKLVVATFNLSEYNDKLESLQQDFAAAHPDQDPRVFDIDSSFILTSKADTSLSGDGSGDGTASASPSASASASSSNAAGQAADAMANAAMGGSSYLDDSAKLAVRMAAGEINTLIAPKDMFIELTHRNAINDLSAALDDQRIAALGDAVVYADDLESGAEHKAIGLDLSKSATWKAKGLPDDAIYGFGNVSEGVEWPVAFTDFLKFE